jgi:hypothetical protein
MTTSEVNSEGNTPEVQEVIDRIRKIFKEGEADGSIHVRLASTSAISSGSLRGNSNGKPLTVSQQSGQTSDEGEELLREFLRGPVHPIVIEPDPEEPPRSES